jgi:two-component system nitrogen regulation response regulator NtrX
VSQRVLIVDDEVNIRRTLRALFESEGYTVSDASSAEEALTVFDDARPDVVLLDLALPGMNGLDALTRFGERAPSVPIVMMSGRASLSDAVEATRKGAFHFIEKTLTPEAVLLTLRGALELSRARDLSRALQRELGPRAELVGTSTAMHQVQRLIERVAPTDARVLITGESGTGKELVAAAIHGISERRDGPFVRVNSAAIPRDLVESELFGHEKGAFTGATDRRRGRFELATGGTLFLDEVGDLGLEAQAKLLRAIEADAIERVGGNEPIAIDVRLIAATNHDLHALVQQGSFREDLLFRLEVVPIRVPPLREREGDVPLLVRHALSRLRIRQGIVTPTIASTGMRALERHHWPGNVRELMNVVERLAILHGGATITDAEVRAVLGPAATQSQAPDGPVQLETDTLTGRLEAYERRLIEAALEASGGNVAEAARRLATDRGNLYRRMRRLGLRNDSDSEDVSVS